MLFPDYQTAKVNQKHSHTPIQNGIFSYIFGMIQFQMYKYKYIVVVNTVKVIKEGISKRKVKNIYTRRRNYRIKSKIVKNERARYTFERYER
jgi:hypothetical protein